MPPRERTRTFITALHTRNGVIHSSAYVPLEFFWESSFPGSCSCYHYKHTTTISGRAVDADNNTYTWSGWPSVIPPIPSPSKLDWGELPTSNELGLIQFFAELDDTIAIFTKKFWQSLSYGSVTWGLVPFISDLKSILKTVIRLGEDLSASRYEDSYTETFVVEDWRPYPGQTYNGTIEVKYHLTGTVDISFHNEATRLLDRLGFHPDAATAWDLLPYSFVVDYFFPVGDFLESFRGGGWTKTAYFSGWQTADAVWRGKYSDALLKNAPVVTEIFQRSPYNGVLVVPERGNVAGEPPSFRELFNTAYVAASRRR